MTMTMTITVWRSNGWYVIHDSNGNRMSYLYYSKREAIRKFRHLFGLVGKHVNMCYIG